MARSPTALALATILALTVLTISAHADEATQKALQAWAVGQGPLPDLIAAQGGLNIEIGPPLTQDELQTVREALWKRQLNNLTGDRPDLMDKLNEPTVFQQMAFKHLVDGSALRAGDFTALHGALLSALHPNTYALAKKWQNIFNCFKHIGDTSNCVAY